MRVALIPARGGSKRIPRKNIRDFMGKPIIAYSIEAAKKSELFNYIFVSTDDQEIADVAQAHGASVWMRNPKLADDKTGTQEVAAEFLNNGEWSEACVIYATAPLLDFNDLIYAHGALSLGETHYAFSVGTTPVLHDAGQFYWGRAESFGHVPLWDRWSRMIPIYSGRDCDINTEEDWLRAEQMFLNLRR